MHKFVLLVVLLFLCATPLRAGETHYDMMVKYHLRMDTALPSGLIVFVGDSNVQGFPVEAVASNVVNFGIGGDTVGGIVARLRQYTVHRRGTLFLSLSVNNITAHDPHAIANIYLDYLRSYGGRVIVSPILPTANDATNQVAQVINADVFLWCLSAPNCVWADATMALGDDLGTLKPGYHIGDGVHLSPAGQRVVIEVWKRALSR